MARRRTLLAAAAGAVATGLAAGVREVAAADRPLATVSVDLARGLGRFPFAPGRQLSAAPKSANYGAATTDALRSLALERARIWLKYGDMAPAAPAAPGGPPVYAPSYPYVDYYHGLADTLLLNWQTSYDRFATAPDFSLAEFTAVQRDALAHFKRRYPKIECIEAENEDFGPGETAADYYRKYVVTYRAVNAVNADIDAGRLPGPRLKVGGPALDIFSELRLGQFLDAYAPTPGPTSASTSCPTTSTSSTRPAPATGPPTRTTRRSWPASGRSSPPCWPRAACPPCPLSSPRSASSR
jgi:hypothetical protein